MKPPFVVLLTAICTLLPLYASQPSVVVQCGIAGILAKTADTAEYGILPNHIQALSQNHCCAN